MIQKVCVIGGGVMGKQIALNTAQYGYDVYLTDTIPEVVDKVAAWASDYMQGRVAKGKKTEADAKDALAHLHCVKTLEEAAENADLVIEAIIEDAKIKDDLFTKLNGLVREDTIITTNSSFMVSSRFVHCVKNPGRLANLHYFNPAMVMQLVEVVRGEHTSDETVDALMEFAAKTGKSPVKVNKEIEGFVANRIVSAIQAEAWYLVTEGICTPQEVDTAVEKGVNHPMGPFRLGDMVGLDVAFLKIDRVYKETGEKPAHYDILKSKIDAGELGRKTGKGWYDYTQKK